MEKHADDNALAGGESPDIQPIDHRKVEGLITDEEADFLVELAKEVPCDGIIVNIGTWKGKSVACLLAGQPNATIITIDVDHSLMPDSFAGVEYVTQDSGEVALAWNKERQIDLLFVDGNHAYGGVLHDTVFTQYLKVGAKAAFHDYDAFLHEATYAIDDWWADHRQQYRKVSGKGFIIVYQRTA